MFEYATNYYWDNGLKIKVDDELVHYYLWHVFRCPHDNIGQQLTKYRAHISVILPLHGDAAMEASRKYADRETTFTYDGFIHIGGRKLINGFKHRNFWLRVDCKDAEMIKEELCVKEENFLGFHITISTNKNRLKMLH